jgi:hypothetical protein
MATDARTNDADRAPALEERLTADEARLEADERRLAADEALIEAEEAEIGENRLLSWFGIAIGGALLVAVTALVLSVVALKHDVRQIQYTAGDGSVGTAAIRDGAVTNQKLDVGAVSRSAIAGEAVGVREIEPNAITGALVARDSLTGADIREGTLRTVPAAGTARTATDSARLGGRPSQVYLSSVVDARVATTTDTRRYKGPLTARCPAGSRVISGGASIRGVMRGAAIVSSSPEQGAAWTASARVAGSPPRSWQLVVTAVCANGGK